MNYKQAAERLGERTSCKIGNNTTLINRGDRIAVKLHETDIITYWPNGHAVLESGGWRTSTTKARFNSWLPLGFAISSDHGEWSVYRYGVKVATYADGLTIGPRGGIHGALGVKESKARKTLKQNIRKYAQLCTDSIPLAMPGDGDCWYCYMVTDDGQTLGAATEDTSHLLSHMDEGYVVPSLVWRALTEAGWSPDEQVIHAIVFGQTELGSFASIAKDAVKKSVVKFMRHRFNL